MRVDIVVVTDVDVGQYHNFPITCLVVRTVDFASQSESANKISENKPKNCLTVT